MWISFRRYSLYCQADYQAVQYLGPVTNVIFSISTTSLLLIHYGPSISTRLTWYLKSPVTRCPCHMPQKCLPPVDRTCIDLVLTGCVKPMPLMNNTHQIIVWWLQKSECVARCCKANQSQRVHITPFTWLIEFHVQYWDNVPCMKRTVYVGGTKSVAAPPTGSLPSQASLGSGQGPAPLLGWGLGFVGHHPCQTHEPFS